MAQQQVENLPAWFTEVSRFGESGEYDRALKVVNRSKYLFCVFMCYNYRLRVPAFEVFNPCCLHYWRRRSFRTTVPVVTVTLQHKDFDAHSMALGLGLVG